MHTYASKLNSAEERKSNYTVHTESIHSASLFPHCVMLEPYSKMDSIHFFLKILHIIPHNDNNSLFVEIFSDLLKRKNEEITCT